MEKIDTDWKTTKLKSLAKLFKQLNRDWAPLKLGVAEVSLHISHFGDRGKLLF